jgi:hypothetical protein
MSIVITNTTDRMSMSTTIMLVTITVMAIITMVR